jgi:hypothetical protein
LGQPREGFLAGGGGKRKGRKRARGGPGHMGCRGQVAMQPHDHDRDDPGSSFFLVYARRALGENGGGLRTHRR